MCKCGCNTCETKTQGPLLTEGKVKSLLSEGLLYHIEHKLPLFETVYRIGSDAHLALIKEARKMYSRNVIDLCEEDEALMANAKKLLDDCKYRTQVNQKAVEQGQLRLTHLRNLMMEVRAKESLTYDKKGKPKGGTLGSGVSA